MKVLFLFIMVLLVAIPITVFSQTFELRVENQTVSGSEFSFDIYMLSTGAQEIYLANTDLALTFNEENFTNDNFTLVSQGDGNNLLSSFFYGYSLDIESSNILLINIAAPQPTSQAQFDGTVQIISDIPPGEKIGTFKVARFSNPSGSVGLHWRTAGTNQTVVATFENTPPWGQINISGNGTYSDPPEEPMPVIVDQNIIPDKFKLHPNFPNPFNPTTSFRFDIPLTGSGLVDATLVIYNSLGQAIRTLYQERLSAGSYEIQWDGENDSGHDAPSGIYFVIFKADGFSQSQKLVLLK